MTCSNCGTTAANSIACGDPCCSGCTHPDPSPIDTHPDTTASTEASWAWLGGKKGKR
jgi:hypothetical protein